MRRRVDGWFGVVVEVCDFIEGDEWEWSERICTRAGGWVWVRYVTVCEVLRALMMRLTEFYAYLPYLYLHAVEIMELDIIVSVEEE